MTYEVRRTNKIVDIKQFDDLYSFPPSLLKPDGSKEIKEREIIEFIKVDRGDHYIIRYDKGKK